MFVRFHPFILAAFVLLLFPILSAAVQSSEQRQFPLTKTENADGSWFVWSIYQRAGYPYGYEPARTFPNSERFRPSPGNIPQVGDVGWWKEFMAIYDPNAPEGTDLRTALGPLSHKALEKKYGLIKWFRYDKPDPPASTK